MFPHSCMIPVFNNESKFYPYFVLVPELRKEHSPLSTVFELLYIDWRTNLKRLRCCLKYKFKLTTAIETCTSASDFTLSSACFFEGWEKIHRVLKIALQNSDRWVQILLLYADFTPRLIEERQITILINMTF